MAKPSFSKEYRQFIKSEDWRVMRSLVFQRDKHKCVKCGCKGTKGNPLQANHLCYPKYGASIEAFKRQPLEQIETVCKNCHKQLTIHARRKARRNNVHH